jgi:hypothetical protein
VKLLAFDVPEPNSPNGILQIKITVEEAIQWMHESAEKCNFIYKSQLEALEDFMAVNWAYWIDEE